MTERLRHSANRLRDVLVKLPRFVKTSIVVTTDLLGFAICVVFALWLIALGNVIETHTAVVFATAVVSLLLAWWLGMYRSVVRYLGLDLLISATLTAVGSGVAGAALMHAFVFDGTPKRWAVAYGIFAFLYICGSRYFARLLLADRRSMQDRENVIIYGAGSTGVQLAKVLRDGTDYVPVAMLDDNPIMQGRRVGGFEVYPAAAVKDLCERLSVGTLLLAMPSANLRRRRKVLEQLSEFPIRVQTVPAYGDIVSGKARVDELSDVAVNDLLGRDPVPPDPDLLHLCVADKSVLVTGAGGSIGSELCRQILRLNPRQLVLLEISETALYRINKELNDLIAVNELKCELVPILGSVSRQQKLCETMRVFDVETVYHAAAYKHVPLVEHNMFEGIGNNVFGTLRTAKAAIDAGVETFVLISTDKAVNPTSIMGASKRLAEMVLQAYAREDSATRFCMVRFGNVLESSGSVVPLFREQIRNGGPVTVTHRDIIRYFMTIPEAAELVIQAGAMAKGGDVFVLDMGEPVRVQDLAHRMIKLMGLSVMDDDNPDGDIEVQYIGLRPAEKLYEELLIGSNVSGTRHPRICRADEDCLLLNEILEMIDGLAAASRDLDFERARSLLRNAVKEYRPQNGIEDRIWMARSGHSSSETRTDKIVEFPGRDSTA